MANNLYISEFELIANVKSPLTSSWNAAAAPVVATPPVAEQLIPFTTTTQSAAFNAKTHIIRIHAEAICFIAFGSDPTATTSSMRMVAGQTEYFGVSPGTKLAVVQP